MALRGVAGPDRVLYGLAALLQNRLPEVISSYNLEKARFLFCIEGDVINLIDDFTFECLVDGDAVAIRFPAGMYTLDDIMDVINSYPGGLITAEKFSKFGILLSCDYSFKVLTAFGNLKAGQIINYQFLSNPITYIISGVLPGEDQIKAFPAICITLSDISPDPDTIMVDYDVEVTLAITSPINTSQVDFLSGQLLRYYDCIRDVLLDYDNGSLGGLINGLTINSASIDEASGNAYFLKLLTISLTCTVEED